MDNISQAIRGTNTSASATGSGATPQHAGIPNIGDAMDINEPTPDLFDDIRDICLQYDNLLIPCDSRVLKANSTKIGGLIDEGLAVPGENGEVIFALFLLRFRLNTR